jgi:hypothetical protein
VTTERAGSVQVLVDADNVAPRRVQPVLDLLELLAHGSGAVGLGAADGFGVEIVGSGRPEALERLVWPDAARLLPHAGWQRADVALAEAYRPGDGPLVLITGDGDFGLLAARHAGPVLVVSGAPSGRLRDPAVVIDPAVEGIEPIRQWLRAIGAVAD